MHQSKPFHSLAADALFCAWANARQDDGLSTEEKYAVYAAAAGVYSYSIMLELEDGQIAV